MRLRYTLVGRAVVGDTQNVYYAFRANQDIACRNDQCQRIIPRGELFTRREWGQRTERCSCYPECAACRPFRLVQAVTVDDEQEPVPPPITPTRTAAALETVGLSGGDDDADEEDAYE